MNRLDYHLLQKTCARLGYPFFDKGDYNLNLIGIRTDDARSNLFNDWLCLAFRQNDMPQLLVFAATTDPGIYWRTHPMNVQGTAIVVPGHYSRVWSLGKHQGKYEALVQRGIIKVYRDNNKNEVLDMDPLGPTEEGYFGINLHHAGEQSIDVGRWSAGCQVTASIADFELLMAVVRRSAPLHGPHFSYTLLTESQLWT